MPVPKKGETFVATVRDVASDGRGILSHPNGLTVFVPGVWLDEEIRVRFTGLQNRIGLGECLELIQPSPHRVTPICPHQGFSNSDCGGCPWQFIDYTEQLKAKQARLEAAFERLNINNIKSILPCLKSAAYRNRAQFKTDGNVIGYMSANSNNIAPIQQCPILDSKNQQTLNDLLSHLPNKQWQVRTRPRRGKPQWTTLNIDNTIEADTVVVNKRLSFQQSNTEQNSKMQAWLRNHLNNNPTGDVLELFCGSGNFTEVIAESATRNIFAVEGDQQAIEQLNKKQLPNVEAACFNLFEENVFADIYRKTRPFSTLVLDPPRDGLKNKNQLLSKNSRFENIYYISCNLATLIRDMQFFIDNNYSVEDVQGIDLSPHTPHLEIMVFMKDKG